MVDSLTERRCLAICAVKLENKKPHELAITMSADGKHYQISLKPAFDVNDKKTWCTKSAFSDDTGVIFLGSALDCDGQTPK